MFQHKNSREKCNFNSIFYELNITLACSRSFTVSLFVYCSLMLFLHVKAS